jgi:hypothetical protein
MQKGKSMDKQQARALLQLYRPGTADAEDPQMAEALKQAQQDPELAQWFENQQNVYVAMRRKLRQIPVPENLKQEILRQEAERRGKIVDLRKFFVPLAAAAAVVALALGAWTYVTRTGRENFADFRDHLVRLSQRQYAMITNNNLTVIHARLVAANYPDYSLTKPLAKLPADGYAPIEWHNRKVSMVCLRADKEKQLFLFVMDAAKVRNAPAASETDFATIHRLNSASWTSNGKIYILAGPENDSDLKRYLD